MQTDSRHEPEGIELGRSYSPDVACLPQAASRARAAAEAAFGPPPPAPDAQPQVTVIKRRKVFLPGRDELRGEVDVLPECNEQARTARVFRLETTFGGTHPAGGERGPEHATQSPTSLESTAERGNIPRKTSVGKRRRKVAHGKVIILGGDGRASRHPGDLPEQPAPAKQRAAESGGFEEVSVGSMRARLVAADEYRTLVSQIASFEKRAEVVRNAEAAKAIRWIRQAVALYRLDARELGL